MPESDKDLPENSQENLDRKLDHAVKETFPTSDPVSVTITKGGAIDYDENGKPITSSQPQGGGSGGDLMGQAQATLGTAAASASEMVDQAKETLSEAAATASSMARGAYEQGQRYARQAAERYPEAERYYRQSSQAVREYVPENPVLILLLGAVAGYGIARVIHRSGRRGRDDRQVPRYTRTRQGYPFAK